MMSGVNIATCVRCRRTQLERWADVTSNDEVTAADIARIAGVGRAAVSNWRRRHPDFPAPVGGPTNSPTFALSDVEAWLSANGRIAGANNAAPTRPARHRKPDAGMAWAMASLLPPLTRDVVLDPACGDGSRLAATAERFGPQVRYVGLDPDPAQLDLANQALSEAGAKKVDLIGEASEARLAKLRHSADAVISMSPPIDRPIEGIVWEYGQPNRSDYPLAWVQICLSYLNPGGTAVVAVPFGVAVRASGRRIRSELLRAGVLTHVIGLPEKLSTPGAAPWQIWVLTQPIGRPAYVLHMVDLTDRDPNDLPRDPTMWKAVFADQAVTRDMPSIQLLDEDVFLVPAAHITAEAHELAPEYAELSSRYTDAVRRLSEVPPALAPGEPRSVAQSVTIGDLARLGAVTFIDPSSVQPGDVFVPSGSGDFEASVLDDTADTNINIKAGSVLRCDPQVLDPHFLACFLRSDVNRRQAAGTLGGTFRLDARRARVPRMPLTEQRRYGETFRQLTAFTQRATEVAAAATNATRTAIHGLTSGVFAPIAE